MSPTFAARVAACFYACGAIVGLLIPLAPHGHELRPTMFFIVSAVSAVVALGLWFGAARLPTWVLPLVGIFGTVLVSLDTYASGTVGSGPASDNELFYIWVAIFGACFFSRRQVMLQIAAVAISYGVVLGSLSTGGTMATRWIETLGTLVAVAGMFHLLRERIETLIAKLADAARTDSLTGLLNRRSFEEAVAEELERCHRTGRPVSLLVADLDHFKQVNDVLGHPEGDAALVRVAEILTYWKRRLDGIARTGGEEFAILLPNTDREAAYGIAERLRGTVESAFSDKQVPLTFSFGVATYPQHATSARALMLAADQALYAAKDLGRNLSVVYSDQVASLVSTETRERRADDDTQLSTVMGLAEALDLRDMGTAAHSQTVARYCRVIAQELGLAPERVERVRIAGSLHDVGKIGLPDTILQKPGPLSRSEWDKVRQHPEIGAGILSSPSFADVRAWVLMHHERPDGRGYPRGLEGDAIPLEARIVSVADAYEAMTAHRPYREAMGHEVARTELLSRAGTAFDARVVSALLAVIERELDEGAAAGAESSPWVA